VSPLSYHPGQRAVQDEAGTRVVADKLADWVGPVVEFARGADMVVLATRGPNQGFRFAMLSGAPPLVQVTEEPDLRLLLPLIAGGPALPAGTAAGGLVIHPGFARRARINGILERDGADLALRATEAFTLCRKYIAPSVSAAAATLSGPHRQEVIPLDDPWLAALVARAEMGFLASASPAGQPDVAHRGGPPGFLHFDPAARALAWDEFVGDGVFKSAGNVRATGHLALLVVDPESGEGACLHGRGEYVTTFTDPARESPLVQHREPYPRQGRMTCTIMRAERLHGLMQPRRRIERVERVTSRSTVPEQKPQ
jgi:hypothetical protein